MKHYLLPLLLTLLFLGACNKDSATKLETKAKAPKATKSIEQRNQQDPQTISAVLTTINIEKANTMIESYLESIMDHPIPQIKSFLIDAATLRALLSDHSIEQVKIHIGHTDSIVQNSDATVFHSLNQDAIALILTGVNALGDYVLIEDSLAIDKTKSCPSNCNLLGTAVLDIIDLY